jgi:ATP-dependent Lhr-like helicase
VFTAPPQFTVLAGRQEVGRTDPMLLTEKIDGPRLLLLGGRSWKVTWIDWKRRRCYVEPAEGGGKARWLTSSVTGASFALSRAVREILLGADPPVALTQRAKRILAEVHDDHFGAVHPGGTVIARACEDVRWWTWAGYRANATLAATLSHLTDGVQRFDDASLRMRGDLTLEMWKAGTADAVERLCLPQVDQRALAGLKFSEALPEHLATATLAARMADLDSAMRLGFPSRPIGSRHRSACDPSRAGPHGGTVVLD